MSTDPTVLPPLTIAVPMLSGAVLAALRGLLPRAALDAVSTLAAGLTLAVAVLLLLSTGGTRVVSWSGGWTPTGGTSVGVVLVADGFGAGLAMVASLLVVAAFVFSWRFFEEVENLFHALVLVFLGSLCGFALSGDLFNLFVWLELSSVVAYALTGYRSEEPQSVQGALTFAVVTSLGACVTLLGISALYASTGELGLPQLGRALDGDESHLFLSGVFVLVCTGFLVKAAIAPFHFWCADAHAVAPTPVCVLFSGVMSQLGVYAIARLYWTVFAGHLPSEPVRHALLTLAVVTGLVGAVMCMAQRHIKRMLAFATVAHLGLFLAAVALLEVDSLAGLAYFLVADAAAKGALFFAAGALVNRFESVDERDLHGRGREMRLTGAVFLVGGVALAGAPPFATAAGKAVVEESAAHAGYPWLLVLYVVVTALTGATVLRAGARVFLGLGRPGAEPEPEGTVGGVREHREDAETGGATLRAVPWTMSLPGVVLLVGAAAVGLVPALPDAVAAAASSFADGAGYADAALGRPEPAPAAPPLRLWTVTGVVTGLAGLVLAVTMAGLALASHRLPPRLRSLGRAVADVTGPLRRAHSGRLGDYVAWLVLGVPALAALLAA